MWPGQHNHIKPGPSKQEGRTARGETKGLQRHTHDAATWQRHCEEVTPGRRSPSLRGTGEPQGIRRGKNQKPGRKEYQRRFSRKQRQTAKETGTCRQCPNPAIPGRTRCESCAVQHKVHRRRRDTERKSQGISRDCDQPIGKSTLFCERHQRRRQEVKASTLARKKAEGRPGHSQYGHLTPRRHHSRRTCGMNTGLSTILPQ